MSSDLGLLLALLAATGAFAGLLAGLLGVGGGIVLVPAFFYIFGALGYGGAHLMQVCVATSLATIVVTSLRSVQAHHAKGAVDWAVLRRWAPFIALGAALGVYVAAGTSTRGLQIVFAGVIGAAGLYMGFGRADWRLGDRLPPWPVQGGMAAVLGFFSAMMGIGGGTFGVPMQTLFGLPIHRAVATAAGMGVAVALPSVLGYALLQVPQAPPLSLGAINLPAFAAVVAMTIITAPYGARLAHRLPAKPLKRAFAIFMILVALNMARKVVGY